jgi:hypothetical protein
MTVSEVGRIATGSSRSELPEQKCYTTACTVSVYVHARPSNPEFQTTSEWITYTAWENHRSYDFVALCLPAQELDQREGERERSSYYSMTSKDAPRT